MMQHLRFMTKYIDYQLHARHKHGYGVHSPFVFELVTEVMYNTSRYYAFEEIENLRADLLQIPDRIEVCDMGAGSRRMKTNQRKIKHITRYASIRPKYGQLLFRLVNHFQPGTIIELGTSMGISTLYMALARQKSRVITIEGSPAIAEEANDNFELLEAKNIEIRVGEFSKQLPLILKDIEQIDFMYFDGNHRKVPTLRYFEQCLPLTHNDSLFIFDDIHWSDGMEQAWKTISTHPKVTATIDLFYCGLVFFRKEMKQQQFKIRF